MPENNITKNFEDITKIKLWLEKQPHLPHKIDDNLLLNFLHTCRYSLEKTKRLMDLFFTMRAQAPEIFGNRDVLSDSIQSIFNVIDLVPLPKPTKENYRVFVYRLSDPDPDKYNFVDSLRAFFIMADIRMKCEDTVYNGQVPIFDMEGYSLRHITKVTLPVLKKYMTYTQEAHPVRLKQIHIINVAPFLDKVLALVKPFMKSEVSAMLHFHLPNSKTLYDFVPKDSLPMEYGGTDGTISEMKKEWLKAIEENREYFLDESRWKVDENKRPFNNENGKQHFGMQGSFRALTLD